MKKLLITLLMIFTLLLSSTTFAVFDSDKYDGLSNIRWHFEFNDFYNYNYYEPDARETWSMNDSIVNKVLTARTYNSTSVGNFSNQPTTGLIDGAARWTNGALDSVVPYYTITSSGYGVKNDATAKTFNLIFRVDNNDTGWLFIQTSGNSDQSIGFCVVDSGGNLELRLCSDTGNWPGQNITVGDWHMATMIYDGSGDTQFFVDGVNKYNVSSRQWDGYYGYIHLSGVASSGWGASDTTNASYDDFMWYNYTLTNTQIESIWNDGTPDVNFSTITSYQPSNENVSLLPGDTYYFNITVGAIDTNNVAINWYNNDTFVSSSNQYKFSELNAGDYTLQAKIGSWIDKTMINIINSTNPYTSYSVAIPTKNSTLGEEIFYVAAQGYSIIQINRTTNTSTGISVGTGAQRTNSIDWEPYNEELYVCTDTNGDIKRYSSGLSLLNTYDIGSVDCAGLAIYNESKLVYALTNYSIYMSDYDGTNAEYLGAYATVATNCGISATYTEAGSNSQLTLDIINGEFYWHRERDTTMCVTNLTFDQLRNYTGLTSAGAKTMRTPTSPTGGEKPSEWYGLSHGTGEPILQRMQELGVEDIQTWNVNVEVPSTIDAYQVVDTTGSIDLFEGEYVDVININVTTTSASPTVKVYMIDSTGSVVLNNVTLTNTSLTEYHYTTDFLLDESGQWNYTIYLTDDSKSDEVNASITVNQVALTLSDTLYGWDYNGIPTNATIITDARTYDFDYYEISFNSDSTWQSILERINVTKLESKKNILTIYDNLNGTNQSVEYINDNFAELITTGYLNTMYAIFIETPAGAVVNSTHDNLINNISFAINTQTSNNFPIRVKNYVSAGLNEIYTPTFTASYINTSNIINEEMAALNSNPYKQRIYYGANKTAASVWFDLVMNNLVGNPNITNDYNDSMIAEMNNGDLVVSNNETTAINKSFQINQIYTGLDVWDSTTSRPVIFGINTTNVTVELNADSAAILRTINLSKLIITNGNYDIFSDQLSGFSSIYRNNYIVDTNALTWPIFNAVASNDYNFRTVHNDPSYINMDFYTYYGTVNTTGIDNMSIYSTAIIIGDHADYNNDSVFDDGGDLSRLINDNNNFYGYLAVNDYCSPANWIQADYDNWLVTKRNLAESWTNISVHVNSFIDGYDLGDVATCDNATLTDKFFTAFVNITDYIHDDKNRSVVCNTYTAYQDVLGVCDGIMKESCITRWNESVTDPHYYYEDWDLEVERHNVYKAFGVPVYCQAFGAEDDYQKAFYAYMAGKGILGYEYFSYNQPKFFTEYTTPASGENWNFDKFPELGAALTSDFTQLTNDTYERTWEYGTVFINVTSHTAEFQNAKVINNMSLHIAYYDGSDAAGEEGNILCQLNGNSSLRVNVSETTIPAGVKTQINISLTDDFYQPEGHYAWICWYDCEGDDCSGKVDSYIYYSYNESILSGRRSMISEATTDHPPLTYDWSFHDSGWVFDFDYTYRSVPTWKWQNWQIWTEINQDQFTRIDDAAGITRTQTGTQDIVVSITTNDHYNIPIYDKEFFVNITPGALQSMVTTDGTVLIANYNESCLTDTPIYNTTTDGSGYDWQACYYDYLEGFNVKLVFPHLSNESVNISVDNENPVVSLALADTYIEYNTNQTVAWNVTDNSTIWPPVGYVITQVVYVTTGDIFANSSAINGTMELVMNGTLGVYEARVNASDEWNNSNYTFIPFTVGDSISPTINNVTLLVGTPSLTTSVDFYINVTDLLLDDVWVVFDGTDYPASLLGNGWYNTNFTSVNTGTHTYSARANDTSNNIITHNGTLILSYSDAVQQDIRNSSFGLEAVMAILILGAIIIPTGLIYVGIKSDNVDPKIYIFGIMTVIGLGILIMIFWIMRASLINAAG